MTSAGTPTRLGFCITDLDPGGAEKAIVQLVTRLDRSTWDPIVWCLSGQGALVDELADADIPVTCLGAAGMRDAHMVWTLSRHLRRRRPALLQTFLFHANIAGRVAGRLAGVPHIVSGIRVAERRSRTRLWLDRLTQRLVDRHVCVSRGVAEFSIAAGLYSERVAVIPNGVDGERFINATAADLSEFGIPPGSRTVIWVGRLDAQKMPLTLLDAAEIIMQTGDAQTHFLIVGAGSMQAELETAVRQRSLSERVHVAGWRKDIAELMKAADCLALTSAWEGMPNVILEAMAAGLPVVSTEVEGVRELIEHGETGLLTAHSPSAVASGLQQLFADPERTSRMGLSAQQVVKQQFTWDCVARAYSDLYCELLQK